MDSSSEREKFEKWAKEHGYDVASRYRDTHYYDSIGATDCWLAWQARAALDSSRVRETPIFPTKDDCHYLDAIMSAAKQIHEEFDCLSDHVKPKKQIREQISSIIWGHLDKARLVALAHSKEGK